MTSSVVKSPSAGHEDAAEPSRTVRILLVDSHTANRTDAAALLRAQGHIVMTVDGGNPALASLQQFQFDLVITELLMPEMDGLELIIRIRNAKHAVPVLAVCDADRPFNLDLLHHAHAFGANATLVRPGLPGQMADTVSRMMMRGAEL